MYYVHVTASHRLYACTTTTNSASLGSIYTETYVHTADYNRKYGMDGNVLGGVAGAVQVRTLANKLYPPKLLNIDDVGHARARAHAMPRVYVCTVPSIKLAKLIKPGADYKCRHLVRVRRFLFMAEERAENRKKAGKIRHLLIVRSALINNATRLFIYKNSSFVWLSGCSNRSCVVVHSHIFATCIRLIITLVATYHECM